MLVNPFGMLMMTSHRQCPRGGGACECQRVGGVFQILGGWMTSRGQCPRGLTHTLTHSFTRSPKVIY